VSRAAGSACLVRLGYYPADPRVRREAEALVDAGFGVDVVCSRGDGESWTADAGGVRIYRLPIGHRRGGIGRYVFEYLGFLALATATVAILHARRRYRIVQVHTMPDFLVFAALVPKLMGAKVVLDMHEVVPELFASKFRLSPSSPAVTALAALERVSTAFADHVLTVSEATRGVIQRRGLPDSKLTIVMNSADERRFEPRPRRPHDGLMLVSHGTIVERYGYDTLLRAMTDVVRERPDARLRIIGGGDLGGTEYLHHLERVIAELGLGRNVELAGYRPLDEIPALLAEADIGITANEIDEFTSLIVPTKLMEYVALEIPAVAARSPAVDLYFDDDDVTFFASGDAAGLARAILGVARDLDAARARAAGARARFVPHYGWPRMKETYVELMLRLAESRPPRDLTDH
jgi:glycosyltransferase involved in cell wall biosynthesis